MFCRYNFLAMLRRGIITPFKMFFSWKPGGGRAGEAVHFVWRIPLDKQERDENNEEPTSGELNVIV